MPYPSKLLNDGEDVVADLHPHWWHFAEPAGALAGSIVFAIIVLVVTDGTTQEVLGWIAIALIVGTAIWLVQRYVGWVSTNFVVTNQRVIFRSGIITKRGIEIPLDRVNTVHFSQRLIERILGAGDLLIESAGTDGQQRFTDVRNPARVQQLIHQQGEMREQSRLHGGGASPGSDVATQLEKLEGMLQRGSLTQEEFDAQKRQLLAG
jgi:uncharacterized membrane protein YdbT with pleckstrin-like domain